MPSVPHGAWAAAVEYAGPLLALAGALAGAWLCRAKPRRNLLPAVGALAVLAGWALMLPRTTVLQAASGPRNGPELLLLPALVGATLSLLGEWAQRARLTALGLVLIAGWWVAGSPAARPEFWRVWAVAVVVAWILSRTTAREPFRGLAAPVALWGGLSLTASGAVWAEAALVAAGAWTGLLAAGSGAVVPSALMAALIVAADLASGRSMRGTWNGADIACVAACAGPLLAGAIASRAKRLGRAGPALSGLMAGLLLAGVAWIAHRAMRT